MTSTETRELFDRKFVREYNKGRLPDMYYSGSIPHELRETVLKTGHKWKFNLSDKEKTKLSDLSEDVSFQTRNSSDLLLGAITEGSSIGPSMPPPSAAASLLLPSTSSSSSSAAAVSGGSGRSGFDSSIYGHNRDSSASNNNLGYSAAGRNGSGGNDSHGGNKRNNNGSRRAAYDYASEIAEEFAPDSRHKHTAQRRAGASAALHGAHRAVEDGGRDGLDMGDDSMLMGGSTGPSSQYDDDIRARAAKQAQYKEKKQQQMSIHARELQSKQIERDEAFFAKLGIDPTKGRITIAPRQDP